MPHMYTVVQERSYLCAGTSTQSTILGIDKTINLKAVNVTVTVFKNITVTTRWTDDHPLMMDTAFWHGNYDTEIYSFFNILQL